MLPPSPCSPRSKKLLIADLMPKSCPISASSSSTTTAPPPPEKRTRDQLNLSDCHGCARRINYTDPKDRLQPLDSVWRIVLLCRKCRKNLYSGKKCPYCFLETGNSGDLSICIVCERRIHKNCLRDYGRCTPWCYSGMGLEGLRVCVDCWVPELLKNSIRASGKGDLRDKGADKDLLKSVVPDAKCELEKKAKRVAKTKDNVLRRANGEMSALDSEGFLVEKDVHSSVEVVDAAEMAIQLHRAISSSPRILRANSLVSSNIGDWKWKGIFYKRSGIRKNCIGYQKVGNCADSAGNERMDEPVENDLDNFFSRLDVELVHYKRDRKRKIWQLSDENSAASESSSSQQVEPKNFPPDDARASFPKKSGGHVFDNSVCVNMDQRNVDRFGLDLVTYKRNRFKKAVQEIGMLGDSRDITCCDNHRVVFRSDYSEPDAANPNTGFPVKSTEVIFPSGSCSAEEDRYRLKYAKRITGTKPGSGFLWDGTFASVNKVAAPGVSTSKAGYSMNKCELIFPIGTYNQETDRYSLKYAKRVKRSRSGSNSEIELHSDAFPCKIEISATGLTVNCSAESRTPSDVSFDSFTLDLLK